MKTHVLLTGITGFLGSHTAIQLLEKGYHVIGTLRNKSRENEIREIISKHTSNTSQLSIVEADLLDKEKWKSLATGVDYIQHIASPFPRKLPKNEAELVNPARNGTLNILEAAAANGVKRVVITSSTGAIAYGKKKAELSKRFTESDWTDTSNLKDTTPYFRSKTLAEKAAWDFIEEDASGLELATVCPGAILGPILEEDFGTSANIVLKAMDGSMPAVPDIGFEIVDVRSVADLLIKAMESPEAANQRYAGTSGFLTFQEVAAILKGQYPNKKIPKSVLPNAFTRLISNFDTTLKPILLELGIKRQVDSSKARQTLSWEPISPQNAVISCAESAIDLGLIKK